MGAPALPSRGLVPAQRLPLPALGSLGVFLFSGEPFSKAVRRNPSGLSGEVWGSARRGVVHLSPSWPASLCLTEAALAPCLGQGLLAGALLIGTGIPSRGPQGRLLLRPPSGPVSLPSQQWMCPQLGERPPPGPFCQGLWITLTWLLCMSGILELDWGVSAGGHLGCLCSGVEMGEAEGGRPQLA